MVSSPSALGFSGVQQCPVAVWREQVRGGFVIGRSLLPGADRVRALVGTSERLPPVLRLTGIRPSQVGPGSVTCSMPVSTLMLDPMRLVDVFILAEATATLAALTGSPPGLAVRCAALSIHHERVATLDAESLLARGVLVHSGRTYGLVEVTVEDGRGRPVTRAMASMVTVDAPDGGTDDESEPRWATPDPWQRDYPLSDPVVLGERSPAELMEGLHDGTRSPGAIQRELGIEYTEMGVGTHALTMPASGWLCDSPDRVAGGAVAAMTAWTMAGAAATLISPGRRIAVLEHHVQLLREVPADGHRLLVRARVTHQVGDFLITTADASDAMGNVVATAGFTSISPPTEQQPTERKSDRMLATILFSDIVGSTDQALSLGDEAWQRLLARHHQIVRRHIGTFRGREVKTTGDGFLVTFEAPARGVQCATAIIRSLQEVGVRVRVGLHTGECEFSDGDVSGVAVHAAARIQSVAEPGQVLVSQTVRDLTAGSGLIYQDAGEHELKGLTGIWQLFEVRT